MTEVFSEVQEALEADPTQVARLGKNRGWLAVVVEARKKQHRDRERLIKAMFRRGAEPVDQREVDYTRGVIDTIDFFLGLPEAMQRRMENDAQ